jgi:hypothetical protein
MVDGPLTGGLANQLIIFFIVLNLIDKLIISQKNKIKQSLAELLHQTEYILD